MTQLRELRAIAKERGLKGYSKMCESDLYLLLVEKSAPRKLCKSQVCTQTQTDFPIFNECGLQQLLTHLCFKAAKESKIVHDGDLEFDAETAELVDLR